jgi:endoglucanase
MVRLAETGTGTFGDAGDPAGGGAPGIAFGFVTRNEWPHLGHRIFRPLGGTRRSSIWYGALHDSHSTFSIGPPERITQSRHDGILGRPLAPGWASFPGGISLARRAVHLVRKRGWPRPRRSSPPFLGSGDPLRRARLAVVTLSVSLAVVACHRSQGSPPDNGLPAESAAGISSAVDAAAPQPFSPNIVVDQFGYRPGDEKIAVIRNPRQGFDAAMAFTPGPMYALVDARSGEKRLEAAPAAWHGGATDPSSGDQAWWFDFSRVNVAGDYFVLDEARGVRSDVFTVSDTVYRDVLKQAVRMLFYQRDGFAKTSQFAGADWVDGAAHLGSCYLYSDPGKDPNRDLHGGWWDAGDFNKYTSWGAEDVIELLRAYDDKPAAFFDDYGIPESGNGVPDLLDEVKWEIDWLVRMQQPDGSVLSIVGEPSETSSIFGPRTPSQVTAPCTYGPATTAATYSTAAAFAYASLVFARADQGTRAGAAYPGFSADLANRARQAYAWAVGHDGGAALFFYNSRNGVGAGEQEVGPSGLAFKKLEAALYLFEVTGDVAYRADFDAKYQATNLLQKSYADSYHSAENEILLTYTLAPRASAAAAQQIKAAFTIAAQSADNLGALKTNPDPYGAYLTSYVWGSNQVKADQGNLLYDVVSYGIDAASTDAPRGAERYLHYLHGVNPLQLVYLSNMGGHGAARSVTRLFHSWFGHDSPWAAVGASKYGPPPGYLTGGPNPGYKWDPCCPAGCSGHSCGAAVLSPPGGQPDQKSYRDFNDDWPLDSWEVTEPDDGYQAKYIRLLSKFVP